MLRLPSRQQNDNGHIRGNILAALCATKNTGEFHWIIYVVKVCICCYMLQVGLSSSHSWPQLQDASSGVKFHAHNDSGASYWRYEMADWSGMQSSSCIAMCKIGRVHDIDNIDVDIAKMDEIFKVIPMAVPDIDLSIVGGKLTCRT